ncbi:hypothetical protein ACHAW6_006437 [Cyclotella cf. meneghiniana]
MNLPSLLKAMPSHWGQSPIALQRIFKVSCSKENADRIFPRKSWQIQVWHV